MMVSRCLRRKSPDRVVRKLDERKVNTLSPSSTVFLTVWTELQGVLKGFHESRQCHPGDYPHLHWRIYPIHR